MSFQLFFLSSYCVCHSLGLTSKCTPDADGQILAQLQIADIADLHFAPYNITGKSNKAEKDHSAFIKKEVKPIKKKMEIQLRICLEGNLNPQVFNPDCSTPPRMLE